MATKNQRKPAGTSLALFKAWLSGIEEMQGDDWVPNIEQWKRIKEKLMAIEESVPMLETAPPPPLQHYTSPYIQAPQSLRNNIPPTHIPSGSGLALPGVKTPDIDSSGGYTSDLA